MRVAAIASVSVALVLIATKFAAWVLTDSVSLLSTLIDSFLDAAASILNLIAVHHALQPADREHRFGHGKAEPLASLAQSAFRQERIVWVGSNNEVLHTVLIAGIQQVIQTFCIEAIWRG